MQKANDDRNGPVESFAVVIDVPETGEGQVLVRKIEGGRRHTLP